MLFLWTGPSRVHRNTSRAAVSSHWFATANRWGNHGENHGKELGNQEKTMTGNKFHRTCGLDLNRCRNNGGTGGTMENLGGANEEVIVELVLKLLVSWLICWFAAHISQLDIFNPKFQFLRTSVPKSFSRERTYWEYPSMRSIVTGIAAARHTFDGRSSGVFPEFFEGQQRWDVPMFKQWLVPLHFFPPAWTHGFRKDNVRKLYLIRKNPPRGDIQGHVCHAAWLSDWLSLCCGALSFQWRVHGNEEKESLLTLASFVPKLMAFDDKNHAADSFAGQVGNGHP